MHPCLQITCVQLIMQNIGLPYLIDWLTIGLIGLPYLDYAIDMLTLHTNFGKTVLIFRAFVLACSPEIQDRFKTSLLLNTTF